MSSYSSSGLAINDLLLPTLNLTQESNIQLSYHSKTRTEAVPTTKFNIITRVVPTSTPDLTFADTHGELIEDEDGNLLNPFFWGDKRQLRVCRVLRQMVRPTSYRYFLAPHTNTTTHCQLYRIISRWIVWRRILDHIISYGPFGCILLSGWPEIHMYGRQFELRGTSSFLVPRAIWLLWCHKYNRNDWQRSMYKKIWKNTYWWIGNRNRAGMRVMAAEVWEQHHKDDIDDIAIHLVRWCVYHFENIHHGSHWQKIKEHHLQVLLSLHNLSNLNGIQKCCRRTCRIFRKSFWLQKSTYHDSEFER